MPLFFIAVFSDIKFTLNLFQDNRAVIRKWFIY